MSISFHCNNHTIMSRKLFWLLLSYIVSQSTAVRELKMVYILTGNTYYSSDLITLGKYENNDTIFGGDLSYKFLSINTVDMPKAQKLGIFNFATKIRETYNALLGREYSHRLYDMRTSEFPTSMITGLLINAGLWPPMVDYQKWNDQLNWQPIPYEYQSMAQDVLLLGTQCPNFQLELTKFEASNESDFDYENLINYVQNNTELTFHDRTDVIQLYHILQSMILDDNPLPFWARDFYTNGTLRALALQGYKMLSETPLQKQLNGGTFLKKMLYDFENFLLANKPRTKVMSIVVGDDINVAGVMANLNLDPPLQPNTQLALIFELYFNNNTKLYEITIKNQIKDLSAEIQTLKMSQCETNCPLDEFQQIIADVTPKDEMKLCGKVKYETVIDIQETESVSIIKENNFAIKGVEINHLILMLGIYVLL